MILWNFCLHKFVRKSYKQGILKVTDNSQVGVRLVKMPTVRPIYRTGVQLPSRCCILYIFFQQL
jgi:hypothetical protein